MGWGECVRVRGGQKMVPEGMSCRHTALRVRLFIASKWMLNRRMRRSRGCRRCWLSEGWGVGKGRWARVGVEERAMSEKRGKA